MADPDERVPDTDQGSGSVQSTPLETSAERAQQAGSLAQARTRVEDPCYGCGRGVVATLGGSTR